MKSGYKTTEFYTQFLPHIIAIVVLSGLLTPEQGGELQEAVTAIIGGVFGIGGIFLNHRYIASREQIKLANKVATVTVNAVEDLAR